MATSPDSLAFSQVKVSRMWLNLGFGNHFEQQLMYFICFHEQEKVEKEEKVKVEVEVSPSQVPRQTESVVGEPD